MEISLACHRFLLRGAILSGPKAETDGLSWLEEGVEGSSGAHRSSPLFPCFNLIDCEELHYPPCLAGGYVHSGSELSYALMRQTMQSQLAQHDLPRRSC